MKCICKYLGKIVKTPKGKMILVELYANGNCACIPEATTSYYYQLREFHISSIKFLKIGD